MKILCRSQTSTAVCRSYVSTAVCRTNPRAVNSPCRSIKYSRLSNVNTPWSSTGAGDDGIEAVTLPMLTKKEPTPPELELKPRSTTTSAPKSDQPFQAVVMRVSIHCQGCARKVRKHISTMEGVSSITIDIDSKKVTVMGQVSPVEVLESISKVKRAEFWT